jgi:Domain of unknown function (DUF4440)
MIYAPQVVVCCLGMLGTTGVVGAQQSRWASDDDATAQSMIALERQWAEQQCTHKVVVDTLLADDFHGTAPDGTRYTKQQAVQKARSSEEKATDCRLDEAKVHFFGETVAVVYGRERATIAKDAGGEEQCLVWTDTWLKRDGQWQIVSAQDMRAECL